MRKRRHRRIRTMLSPIDAETDIVLDLAWDDVLAELRGPYWRETSTPPPTAK
jgi:hypothetical protein